MFAAHLAMCIDRCSVELASVILYLNSVHGLHITCGASFLNWSLTYFSPHALLTTVNCASLLQIDDFVTSSIFQYPAMKLMLLFFKPYSR